MREYTDLNNIFSAKAATGTGTAILVKDFRHILLQFGSASSANLTVKFQGSFSEVMPDFSAAQSVANHWDYIASYDLQSSSLIAGDTGIALTGTDDFRNLMINTDGLVWVCATITARSAGSLTLKVLGMNQS
jgi:hypothetical protein